MEAELRKHDQAQHGDLEEYKPNAASNQEAR